MNYEFIPVFKDDKSAEALYSDDDHIEILGFMAINDCTITFQNCSEIHVKNPVFGECIIHRFEYGNYGPFAIKI